jgi:hypothetical protein
MSDPAPGTQTWIDAIATPFDRAWRAVVRQGGTGPRPRIEDCLAGVEGARRSLLLEELLRIELDWRREAGEAPTAEEYQSRFPEHARTIGGLFAEAAPSPPRPPIVDGGRGEVDDPRPIAGPADAIGPDRPPAIEADPDATLSYSVARGDGKVEPLLSQQDFEQLATTFFPGMVLQGRYILERELGRGGMGMVFLGRDNRLNPRAVSLNLNSRSPL